MSNTTYQNDLKDSYQTNIVPDRMSSSPYRAPMSAAVKPTQFKSGNEEGKTNTCLKTMAEINKYFMSLGQALDQNNEFDESQKNKKPIHVVFTNNSLIETKQWKNKVANFGVNTMAIFSSQDTKTKGEIDSLILTGDENGHQVNYLMACANSVRIDDIIWLIRQYSKKHKEYVFNIFLDEFDKINLYVHLIRSIQSYSNVANIVAISATAYSNWFRMLYELGYSYVPLLTKIEDASEYRRIKEHRLMYTDNLYIEDPVKNFEFILNNPGLICYESEDKKERIHLPNLKDEKGKILFVPGTFYTSSHDDICQIANNMNWNCLILNGKKKGFYYPDGSNIQIKAYREAHPHLFNESTSIMGVAQVMYNDSKLNLKETNLVITGFNCVERGVTFNTPEFQFHACIFSPYHYREGSKEKESIIQLAGRATGWKNFVPYMIILAPKYLIEEVSNSQDRLIEFLKTSPTYLTYADMIKDENAIPIRLDFLDQSFLTIIEDYTGNKNKRWAKILEGINEGKIKVSNANRENSGQHSFFCETTNRTITVNPNYKLKTIRSCTKDTKFENYRFDSYIEAENQLRGYGQSNKEGDFSVDLNFFEHTKNNIHIPRGVGFISYAFIDKK